MRAMIRARRKIVDWLEIAAELVCDHNAWVAELGDKPLQETSRGFRVSLSTLAVVRSEPFRFSYPPFKVGVACVASSDSSVTCGRFG